MSRQQALATPAPHPKPGSKRVEIPPYSVDEHGFWLAGGSARNPSPDRLTNFVAAIMLQRIYDGGSDADVRREYVIDATIDGRGVRFEIPAHEFVGMAWPDRFLGSRAVVFPGFHLRDHAATAIKLLSGRVPTEHRRTHPGWARIEGRAAFLHAGGAIGPGHTGATPRNPDGGERPDPKGLGDNGIGSSGPSGPCLADAPPGVTYLTTLPKDLRGFELPAPTSGDELGEAISAALGLVGTAPDHVTFALLAATFRAPLGDGNVYVNLVGATDSGKSVYASLFQRFFGASMDEKHPPAHWKSTGNYLETLLYHAKDVLVVIDDFVTEGNLADVQRQQAKADQVLRGLFNNSGRGRANGDGSIRDCLPPRAVVVSTGEVPFRGASIVNRGLNLDFVRAALDWDGITAAQHHAARGDFARVMSSYLAFLAPRHDDFQREKARFQATFEERARGELPGRGRAAGVVASLYMGFEVFTAFACHVGAIAPGEMRLLNTFCWNALLDGVRLQPAEQGDPVEAFFSFLQTAFVSGRAHVADPEGGCPNLHLGHSATGPEAFGWHRWSSEDQVKRFDDEHGGSTTRTVAVTSGHRPRGERIGWSNGSILYLHPTAALRAAKAVARGIDATVDLTPWTLGKLLFDRGLLVRSERRRNRYTARENLGGTRANVLILRSSHVFPPPSASPSECRLYECEDDELAEVRGSFDGLIA